MDRRRFLEIFGGLTVTALPGFRYRPPRDRVVVAGGGIIGASIAYHLARRGSEVIVLEKESPGAGATSRSFAWLNATFSKQPEHYHLLNRLSLQGYLYLQQEWKGELVVQWGGSLEWYGEAEPARRLREGVRRAQEWGYATRLVGEEEIHRLEPGVVPGAVLAAAHAELEGSIDPLHAVDVFLRKAEEQGARVIHPCEVTGLDVRQGRLRAVRSSQGDFQGDVLVVACGVDTSRVAALAGLTVPLVDSPGVLAHVTPQPRRIQRVVLAPGAHIKQKPDGRIVTGVGFSEKPSQDASREEGERILQAAARYVPALESARLEKMTLGMRPLPADGYPIVGVSPEAPDVYVTVMHSGMTLAPLIGQLAAMEILDGVQVDLLEPYRLARFA
ncbi:MAG: FAD-binding oxidoreductase [Gemmatimonadetes bacterium]|nr:FAD-binding oxidoreductase [Gemmatimonadota bacterium]